MVNDSVINAKRRRHFVNICGVCTRSMFSSVAEHVINVTMKNVCHCDQRNGQKNNDCQNIKMRMFTTGTGQIRQCQACRQGRRFLAQNHQRHRYCFRLGHLLHRLRPLHMDKTRWQ